MNFSYKCKFLKNVKRGRAVMFLIISMIYSDFCNVIHETKVQFFE